MARQFWLPDVLRAAGLTVHEYDGWRERGRESFGPIRGIVCHGTGGSLHSSDDGELRTIAITGSETATAPIAQLYQSRSGAWWVVASGTCTGVKTGTAGPLQGHGDDVVLQIEAQHRSGEPWSAVQYWSYVRGVAALAVHKSDGYDVPLAHVIGHGEHQPGDKTDPWFDMTSFRADVAAVLNGDDMAIDQNMFEGLAWRMDAVICDSPVIRGGPTKGERNQGFDARKALESKVDSLVATLGTLAVPAPVDAAALKAVLLDPDVLAAIAAAVVNVQANADRAAADAPRQS